MILGHLNAWKYQIHHSINTSIQTFVFDNFIFFINTRDIMELSGKIKC